MSLYNSILALIVFRRYNWKKTVLPHLLILVIIKHFINLEGSKGLTT